jgi:hypothetical protein
VQAVADLRAELDRHDVMVTRNRIALAHLEAASEIVRATNKPEVIEDLDATANAIISAAQRFPEAVQHLDAVPPSSPYGARAAALREEISRREKVVARLKSASGPEELRPVSGVPSPVRPNVGSGCDHGSCDGVPTAIGVGKTVRVAPYIRKDGTPVQGHNRAAPARR